jgi:hypothetical protein
MIDPILDRQGEMACGDQPGGSRICWMFTRLPTPPTGRSKKW